MTYKIYSHLPKNLTHAVFDVDQTLYRFSSNFQYGELDKSLLSFAKKAYHKHTPTKLTEAEILKKYNEFYEKYGNSMVGIAGELSLDLRYLFNTWLTPENINYKLLPLCEESRKQLNYLRNVHKFRLALFTNGTDLHAHRVTAAMGLDGLFGHILGINHADFAAKPNPKSYENLLWELNAKPEEIIFFEDSLRNLKAARQMCFGYNVYIGEKEAEAPENKDNVFDLWAPSLPEALEAINQNIINSA